MGLDERAFQQDEPNDFISFLKRGWRKLHNYTVPQRDVDS